MSSRNGLDSLPFQPAAFPLLFTLSPLFLLLLVLLLLLIPSNALSLKPSKPHFFSSSYTSSSTSTNFPSHSSTLSCWHPYPLHFPNHNFLPLKPQTHYLSSYFYHTFSSNTLYSTPYTPHLPPLTPLQHIFLPYTMHTYVPLYLLSILHIAIPYNTFLSTL